MPTYEYKCTDCGHCFEVMHGVNENVDSCETCGSPVRRVFHPVGVIFKGSGFYSTDNRSKGGNGGKPAGAPDTAEAKKPEEAASPDSPTPPGKADKPVKTEKSEKPEPA